MDKSGKAEGMFHDSFNRQLDRGEEAKAQAAAAEQAALKHALDERRLQLQRLTLVQRFVRPRRDTRATRALRLKGRVT